MPVSGLRIWSSERVLAVGCGSDEFADRCFEFLHAGVRAALDLSLCKEREPAFYLVEPRGMRGSKVQVISCSFLQPAPDQSGLVCAVVVQHEMDVEIGRNRGINLFQEVQELHRTMASIALAKNVAGGDIESSKQACDAMSLIVVGASLPLPTRMGSTGWVRLSAWICDFSSTHNTSA